MTKPVILTGIKPTGSIHLGNLIGAIKPAVSWSNDPEKQGFYFIADYHALITVKDPEKLSRYTLESTAAWIALGLDPSRAVLYRQSDVLEVFELAWILGCFAPKGLMNRAHAYKAQLQKNQSKAERNLDAGVNMGLYSYPLLMAADILIMRTRWVPVGKDQLQHIEIARHVAQAFNHTHGHPVFLAPEALTEETQNVIPGLDGRKMSKSYDNTIAVFGTSDELWALISRIATDSTPKGEPKNPDDSVIFQIFHALAAWEDTNRFRQALLNGMGWKEAKDQLFALLDGYLTEPRRIYHDLMHDPAMLYRILEDGANKARARAQDTMSRVRRFTGHQPM